MPDILDKNNLAAKLCALNELNLMDNTISGEIEKKLLALQKGESRSWAQIALLLMQVEGSNFWMRDAKSFNSWVKKHCSIFRMKAGSLWRYYSAARYYQELQSKLTTLGIKAPALRDLPNTVSPENLEILSKLGRVMPEVGFIELAKKVIASAITRDHLRMTWMAYRPALAGNTARGRGVEAPTIDHDDLESMSTVQRAEVMTAIVYSEPRWTGIKNPDVFECFAEVRPEFDTDVFDVIAIVRANEESPLKIHGILILTKLTPDVVGRCERLTPYCDSIWIALHDRKDVSKWVFIPEHVGILCWTKSSFWLERPSLRTASSGSKVNETMKGLFLKLYRK